jgi:hypothetical protein
VEREGEEVIDNQLLCARARAREREIEWVWVLMLVVGMLVRCRGWLVVTLER